MEFPKTFSCPNCGADEPVYQALAEERKAKVVYGAKMHFFTPQNPPPPNSEALVEYLDVCGNCGVEYTRMMNLEKSMGLALPGNGGGQQARRR